MAAGFWRDTRIRTLPYDRGFLYFVTVDEAVRKASGNTRTLDHLTKEMRALQDQGEQLTQDDWEAVLKRDLGEDGVTALHAMLSGGGPLPSSDAFGPCFRRITRDLQRYELGFEPAALTEPQRDGEEFPITYRPRGETVPAWQWERIADVPEETCRASRTTP